MARIESFETDQKGRPKSIARVSTCAGRDIYLLPIETFPGHRNNVYLIADPVAPTLFDVGTRWSHQQMEGCFEQLRTDFGVDLHLEDLAQAIVSHGHIDHFGNAAWFIDHDIPVLVHELDARSLTNFTQRRQLAANEATRFLRRAGLDKEPTHHLIELYRSGTKYFSDVSPVRRLRDGDQINGWRVLHVPGHSPGMICLAVDDVVLTADHLLSRISPVQSPQTLTPSTGLENYLRSLMRLREFGDFDLGLGAHEAPIESVALRIDETIAHHVERLIEVLDLFEDSALTIADAATKMFGETRGFAWLLAISEMGAHIEYLDDLGYLKIDNEQQVLDDPLSAILFRPLEREAARAHLATLSPAS